MANRSQRREEKALCLLGDHHGFWCAWCLEYIYPEQQPWHLHHIWPKYHLKKLFPNGDFPIDCLLPVHEANCHALLQDESDQAGHRLSRITEWRDEAFESECLRAYLEGNLNHSVYLREWQIRNVQLDLSTKTRSYELNAAAGSCLAIDLINKRTGTDKTTWLERTKPVDPGNLPSWLVYASAVLWYCGAVEEATVCFKELDSHLNRWRPSSSPLYGPYLRRKALHTYNISDAQTAEQAARIEGESYGRRTAFLSLDGLTLQQGIPVRTIIFMTRHFMMVIRVLLGGIGGEEHNCLA